MRQKFFENPKKVGRKNRLLRVKRKFLQKQRRKSLINERLPTIPYIRYKQIIISLKTLLKNSTEIRLKSKMYVLRKLYKLE